LGNINPGIVAFEIENLYEKMITNGSDPAMLPVPSNVMSIMLADRIMGEAIKRREAGRRKGEVE
jgi:hypothetical protein